MKSLSFILMLGVAMTLRAAIADGGVPQFKAFPAKSESVPAPVEVQLSDKRSRAFRTRLREGIKEPVNFAGHYVLTTWGCGIGCAFGAAIDKLDGHVVFLPAMVCCWMEDGEMIEWRADSRLLVLGGLAEGTIYGAHFYVLDGREFRLLKVIPIEHKDIESPPSP